MFEYGRNVCNQLSTAQEYEWLVTNGIGGYASGTIAGLLTRRYHGLLIAALNPPLGRTLLLTKLDETVTYYGQGYPLYTNRWAGETVEPHGFDHIDRFHLEGTTPVWTFACADAIIEKRIWMEAGANTTYIHYSVRRASAPVTLSLKALVNYRDYHGTTHADNWRMQITPVARGLRITAYEGAIPLYVLIDQGQASPQHEWYQRFYLAHEALRGLEAEEDNLYAGFFQATLPLGQSLTVVASTNPQPLLDGRVAYAHHLEVNRPLSGVGRLNITPNSNSGMSNNNTPHWLKHLRLVANQFIVQRPLPENGEGHSIIAGYPWFGDWGRDTMVALPGLTLTTGQPHIARSVLRTFARFVDQGMLPNRFPDVGQQPEYNTVDATLWYFHAVHQYLASTNDASLAKELYPVLAEIINWHRQGTRYNIRVDPKDGLLYAGEPGWQLTWMDAKVGDWVITPRIGKPVEVNALWHNALRIMALLAALHGDDKTSKQYTKQANFVADNFRRRFWYEAEGYLCDVIDGPAGSPGTDGKFYDRRLRPNQIFAVSLPFKLLKNAQAKSVVNICTRYLLTPHGLRTLAPNQPGYTGHYGGNQHERDSAYHQGTVWSWLIGPFIKAHLRVYRNPDLALSYLQPLIRHLESNCVGNISEIFDGDAPFTARGAIAQAWSVAEMLQAWQAIRHGLPGQELSIAPTRA